MKNEESLIFNGPCSDLELQTLTEFYPAFDISSVPTPRPSRCISRHILDEACGIYSGSPTRLENIFLSLLDPHQQTPTSLVLRSVITIQSYWRGFVARKAYSVLFSRQTLSKNRLLHLKHVEASVIVQRIRRAYSATKTFKTMQRAILRIQRFWKLYCARKKAAATLQAWWKMTLARTRYKKLKRMTIYIQATWRMIQTSRYFDMLCMYSILVQSQWRMIMARRRFNRTLNAVIRLQIFTRALIRSRHGEKTQKSTVAIQRWWRNIKNEQLLSAVICIQTRWRMNVAKRRFGNIKKAVIRIQFFFKGKIAKKKFKTIRCAVLLIQKWWRRQIGRRQQAFTKAQHISSILSEKCNFSTGDKENTKLLAVGSVHQNVYPQDDPTNAKTLDMATFTLEEKKKMLANIRLKRSLIESQLGTVSITDPREPLLSRIPSSKRVKLNRALTSLSEAPMMIVPPVPVPLTSAFDAIKADTELIHRTRINTKKNSGYKCQFFVEIIKKEGFRPESPVKFGKKLPVTSTEQDSGDSSIVKWHTQLEHVYQEKKLSAIRLNEPDPVPSSQTSSTQEVGVLKGCLKRKKQEFQYVPLSPELQKITIPVKRIVYEKPVRGARATSKKR